MQSNITEPQLFNTDVELAEPHFDEEATILSARPVVPLREINAEARSRRRLVLASAIVVSLVAGAVGASLIYRQRDQKSISVASDQVINESGVGPTGPATSAASGDAGETVTVEESREVEAPLAERKAESRLKRSVGSEKVATRQKKAIDPVAERGARRVERVEARLLRRQAEREARREARGKRKSQNELLRIREIFEGTPRQ